MKNCEYYGHLIEQMLDGQLTSSEERELNTHAAECPECNARLQEFKEMANVFQTFDVQVPDELHEHIMSAVRTERACAKKKKRLSRLTRYRWAGAVAACAVFAIGIAAWNLLPGTSKNESAQYSSADTAAPESFPMLPETPMVTGEARSDMAGSAETTDGATEQNMGVAAAGGTDAPTCTQDAETMGNGKTAGLIDYSAVRCFVGDFSSWNATISSFGSISCVQNEDRTEIVFEAESDEETSFLSFLEQQGFIERTPTEEETPVLDENAEATLYLLCAE